MSARVARWVRVGAWFVATALIVLLVRAVDPRRAFHVVAHTSPLWLVVAIASNAAIQPLGALQWRSLLPDGIAIPFGRMFRLFALTSVANNTTPSLIGHAAGAMLLANESDVGKANALSVVALDQIAVGIAKIAVIGCAAVLLPLPTWMRQGLAGLALGVGVLLVAGLVVATRTRHLAALRQPKRFSRGLACAVAVKAAEAGAIFAVQHAFGLDVTAQTVVVVLAASALGSVVPIAPANIGTYEAASFGAYRYLGFDGELALGIAVVQHVCQLLPAVGIGYVLLSLPRFSARAPASSSPKSLA